MKIKAKFSEELTDFYSGFQDESETFIVSFGENIIIEGNYDEYTGEYYVTPNDQIQRLATYQKYMVDDVTVYKIPYAEVSNDSGGYTATIGGQ